MLAVARVCPRISKAMFMFDKDCADDLSILNEFPHLIDLDLWGGRFYSDGLCEYIQSQGNKMTHLSLVHVEEIDKRCSFPLDGMQDLVPFHLKYSQDD